MRAAWYERYGAAREVLRTGEVEMPEPGPGEVRVRLSCSGVNPSDVKRRAGLRSSSMPFPRIIPHSDGAGVIDAVGEGVSRARLGERVWTYNAQWNRPFGTAAQYIALSSAQAVHLADQTEFSEGACLGIPALTAYHCVFADGPVIGQTILVTGGAGAVGSYALQLALNGGATVITTVSSDAKAEITRNLGAKHIINYRTEDVAARVNEITEGLGVDRIVEVAFGSNLGVAVAVLKQNGVVAAYASDASHHPSLPFYSLLVKGVTVRFIFVYTVPELAQQRAARELSKTLEAGRLRHPDTHVFQLADIVEAHEAVERNELVGKVIVDVT